ncbi:hypothetical protein ZHAS_00003675 [Anopheles sinensis]|uniref:Uncharacterized protein n=1 Tax=Anopheles sinensis TaxID=74873 RepID=A0A084VEX7_ANOSI|nr:hypothetical protein ZHAS_00003675 [Anopheles sinensis]
MSFCRDAGGGGGGGGWRKFMLPPACSYVLAIQLHLVLLLRKALSSVLMKIFRRFAIDETAKVKQKEETSRTHPGWPLKEPRVLHRSDTEDLNEMVILVKISPKTANR